MPAHYFCCCLPLRLGAFLISTFQLVIGGLLAGAGFYILGTLHHLPSSLKGIVIASSVYYTVFAITALIGLFGTIAKNAPLLSTYAFYLAWSTCLQIALHVAQLVLFFRKSRASLIRDCIDGSTDKNVQDLCNNSFDTSKWSLIAGMIVGLIIQFWAAYIVASYAEKLKIERLWRSGPVATPLRHTGHSKYAHGQHHQGGYGINVSHTNASYDYPYKDGSISRGGSMSMPHHY